MGLQGAAPRLGLRRFTNAIRQAPGVWPAGGRKVLVLVSDGDNTRRGTYAQAFSSSAR